MNKKKKFLISRFSDLRNEYPDTIISTISGPCGSGKTLFSKLLAQKSNGFSISLDTVAVGDFISQNVPLVEKIACKKYNPQTDDVGEWFVANILDSEKKFLTICNPRMILSRNDCVKLFIN